ncbi:lipopolysaccharide biosynthesis protein [Paenibacillus sp. FJAT-27812]|uniref:lipopolysaccharide biosynthesis protein n=1 Tax=Paenibacillus sp. FJAT-27812 TaxID=1684143 RepID=UPI0006A7DA70|nr:oligosaccharide flippase family protein [Paenibacillus sp. FJAT-27812]
MRVKSSLLNITAGIGNQIIITILSFVSRTVFINSLGIEYLGINGLFTSILAMLSLAEAGIGSSIVYNLYKPVADNDRPKIMALMNLYKKAYLVIAGVVLLLGLSIMPFLDVFIKNTSVENISFIYLLFLINTVTPYLFIYKYSFLNVNQKNYIVTAVFSVSSILSVCAKIAILYFTQQFIFYLIIECVVSLMSSIILAKIVDRMYPFLRQKKETKLDPDTKANFIKNMKAILLQNIGTYFIFGVDSILISSFISVAAVGLYSNYKMLIDLCRTFINQVFANMYHSLGNLVAKESEEKVFHVFKVTMLLNFWLYSLLAIMLYLFIEPLILVWIGSEFVMGPLVVLLLIITFYERGMRNSITMLKTTAGIFHEDRFAPLCQAALNLSISFILVQRMGIAGIFIGTLVSALLVPFWTTPYFVYKRVFKQPLKLYFTRYGYYSIIAVIAAAAAAYICSFLPAGGLFWLLVRGTLCFLLINAIYAAVFHRTEEFKYLLGVAEAILSKIPKLRALLLKRSRHLEVSGNK